MKTTQLLACLLAVLLPGQMLVANDAPSKDGWSEPVNGLRARLVSGERHTQTGAKLSEVYLELHNVSDRGMLMEFDYNASKSVHFELQTADGKRAPKAIALNGGNRCHDTLRVQLPIDGSLRFPVSCHSAMAGAKSSRILQLDPEDAIWEISVNDTQEYFLSGTLEVPKLSHEVRMASWPNWRWDGAVKIPAVRIPGKKYDPVTRTGKENKPK